MTIIETSQGARCGNKIHGGRAYHPTAADVRQCYADSARIAQIAADHRAELMPVYVPDSGAERTADVAMVRGVLEQLKGHHARVAAATARVHDAAAPAGPVTEDGMYRNPDTGEIFKVQWNRASGDGRRLYAKRLVMVNAYTGVELTNVELVGPDPSANWSSRFEYAAGAMREIRADWRMTLDEAKQFGALYGTCIRCGRELTDEKSIEQAMGPVCITKI